MIRFPSSRNLQIFCFDYSIAFEKRKVFITFFGLFRRNIRNNSELFLFISAFSSKRWDGGFRSGDSAKR